MGKLRRIALLMALLVFCNFLYFAQDSSTKYQGKVISVIDGNTLTILTENKKIRVRLLGIETPTQAFSKESRENLEKLVNGKSAVFLAVPLELKTEKEKILVGKVFVDNVDVAASQVANGFAWQSFDNEKYVDAADDKTYAEAGQHARESKSGVWNAPFKECKDAAVKTSVEDPSKLNADKNKNLNIFGSVIAALVIDESGNVISARALCGHPILQTKSVDAALRSKFKATGSRIEGNIVYNFVPE